MRRLVNLGRDEQHSLVPEAALVVVDPIEVATTRLIP